MTPGTRNARRRTPPARGPAHGPRRGSGAARAAATPRWAARTARAGRRRRPGVPGWPAASPRPDHPRRRRRPNPPAVHARRCRSPRGQRRRSCSTARSTARDPGSRTVCLHDIAIELRHGGSEAGPAERGGPVLPPPDQELPRRVVLHRVPECTGQLIVVTRVDEACRIAQHFGERTGSRGDDGNTRRHRLQGRKPEAFVDRRVGQERRAAEEGGEDDVAHPAEPPDPVRGSGPRRWRPPARPHPTPAVRRARAGDRGPRPPTASNARTRPGRSFLGSAVPTARMSARPAQPDVCR